MSCASAVTLYYKCVPSWIGYAYVQNGSDATVSAIVTRCTICHVSIVSVVGIRACSVSTILCIAAWEKPQPCVVAGTARVKPIDATSEFNIIVHFWRGIECLVVPATCGSLNSGILTTREYPLIISVNDVADVSEGQQQMLQFHCRAACGNA